MRVYVLASGSDGNATVFEAGGTRVLVDAGIGSGALVQRLVDLGAGGMPHAIVVTHAHQDHVGQAARIAKRLRIPVYALEAAARESRLCERLPRPGALRFLTPNEPFSVGAITALPVPVPHDAAQVAFVVEGAGQRAVIATDLGELTTELVDHAVRSDVVLLESNYDQGLLRTGPYPASLKRRVESGRGHLSNVQAHALLRRLTYATRAVVLLHLSRTNNTLELALEVARDALAGRRVDVRAAAPRDPFVIDATAPRPGVPLLSHAGKKRVRVAPGQLLLF